MRVLQTSMTVAWLHSLSLLAEHVLFLEFWNGFTVHLFMSVLRCNLDSNAVSDYYPLTTFCDECCTYSTHWHLLVDLSRCFARWLNDMNDLLTSTTCFVLTFDWTVLFTGRIVQELNTLDLNFEFCVGHSDSCIQNSSASTTHFLVPCFVDEYPCSTHSTTNTHASA